MAVEGPVEGVAEGESQTTDGIALEVVDRVDLGPEDLEGAVEGLQSRLEGATRGEARSLRERGGRAPPELGGRGSGFTSAAIRSGWGPCAAPVRSRGGKTGGAFRLPLASEGLGEAEGQSNQVLPAVLAPHEAHRERRVLRAEPALNQPICSALRLCRRRMRSSEPSA